MSINLHILAGTVEAKPEPVIKTVNDKRVAEFRLYDGFGWHSVTVWGKDAEKCPKPGDYVLVQGRVQTRSYDKDGEKRYFTSTNANSIEFPGRTEEEPPRDLGF